MLTSENRSRPLPKVYNAVGATADPALKRRVLEWALSEIKLQDFFYPIGSVSASRSVPALDRSTPHPHPSPYDVGRRRTPFI